MKRKKLAVLFAVMSASALLIIGCGAQKEKLKADTAKARSTEDVLENAKLYQSEVLEDMEELRKAADEAETLIPDDLLPYPTYGKLLFYI